jgi:large repetitive protein
MGTLSRYPDDPQTTFLGTNTTLDLLGQESGHRWLAFLRFIDENGQANDALLGRDLAHWSFCHNSLASDMEGNEIREDGGDRFTTINATARYSPLDQYAMGLIPAEDVPPFFYVDGCSNPGAAPEIGIGMQGHRVDVTIQQIIAAEGARVPAANKAPHDFKMAFLLVAPADPGPSDAGIAHVDRIRAAWEPYFAGATDGNGSVSTALKLKPRR